MLSKKLVASIVCLSMVMMLAPATGQAATAEELQAQIEALQKQLAELQAQLVGSTTGTTTSTAAPAACVGITFTRNLTLGSTGTDVKCLQALLNQSADTQVAASGVGSSGNETMYFGALTKTAVIKFQNKYAAGILTPVGLTAGTGFVGVSTRAKLNAMLTAAPAEEEATEEGEEAAEEETTTPTTEEKTEGTVTVTKNPSPAAGVKIYESNEKVAALGILVKAKNSSISVERIKLQLASDGAGKPWDYISKMYIYDGEDMLMSKEITSSSVYKESSNYYINLTGIGAKVAKDGQKILTVKVDAKSVSGSIYSSLPDTLTYTVGADYVRGVDTMGLNQYGPTAAFTNTITFDKTRAAQAQLVVSLNANSPKKRNIGTGADGDVEGVTLTTFDIKASYDRVKITDVKNLVVTPSAGLGQSPVVYLYEGDNLLSSATVSSTDADFTDIEVYIDKDTTKTFTIKTDITGADATAGTIYAVVTGNATNIVAENSSGTTLSSSTAGADLSVSGTATGYTANVYQIAPVFTVASITTSSSDKSTAASSTISATFSIQVKAEGGDVYISKQATANAFTTHYAIDGTDTDAVSSVTYTQPTNTTAATYSYKVAQDNTATFSVSASFAASSAGNFDLRTTAIAWDTDDDATPDLSSTYMNGEAEWISAVKYLQ